MRMNSPPQRFRQSATMARTSRSSAPGLGLSCNGDGADAPERNKRPDLVVLSRPASQLRSRRDRTTPRSKIAPHPHDNENHIGEKRNWVANGEYVISAPRTKKLPDIFVDLAGDGRHFAAFEAPAASQEGQNASCFRDHITAPYPSTITWRVRTDPKTQNRVSIPGKRNSRVISQR